MALPQSVLDKIHRETEERRASYQQKVAAWEEQQAARQAERIATSPAVPRNDMQTGAGQTMMGTGAFGVQRSPAALTEKLFGADQISRERTADNLRATMQAQAPSPTAFVNSRMGENRLSADTAQKNMLELVDRYNKRNSIPGLQEQIAEVDRQIEAAKAESKQSGYTRDPITMAAVYQNQGQIDALQTQRGALEAQLEQAKTQEWENQQRSDILAAGGEELLSAIKNYGGEFKKRGGFQTGIGELKSILLDLKSKGYSEEQISNWFEYGSRMQRAEEYQQATQQAADFAGKHPVIGSIGSVPLNLLSGAGAVDVMAQKARNFLTGEDTPLDYNTPSMQLSGMSSAIRGQVASDIEKNTAGWAGSDTPLGNLYSGGYQLAMSMADSLGIAGLTAMGVPGATALLGGSAATSAMVEAKERGATDAQALTMGLISGAAETLFEKVSIDSLFSLEKPSTVKAALKNILKQAIPEASEEFNTTIANTVADMIVMGDKSQYETDKRRYLAQGMTDQEAAKQAGADWLNGLMADALGGAISGGLFGAGANAINSFQRSGSSAQRSGTGAAVNTDQMETPTDRLDAAIQETLNPAETPTDRAMLDTFQQLQGQTQTDGAVRENNSARADTTPTASQSPMRAADSRPYGGNTRGSQEVQGTVQTELPRNDSVDAGQVGTPGDGSTAQSVELPETAVGAMKSDPQSFSYFQNQTDNFLPEGANPARPVDMPEIDPMGRQVRRGAKTIYGAEVTSDERAEQMEREFMAGAYGYDPVQDAAALANAKEKISEEGYDRAYARVVERLQSMKRLKETGLEAYLLYADAVKKGNDADAAELCLLLSQSGTEFGQGVQLFSMFRKLTPEGQLMGIQRVVDRINEKTGGKGGKGGLPDYTRTEVIKEITDVRDTALRLIQNIHEAFSPDHGVPVEDWMTEIGKQLAQAVDSKKTRSSQKTVAQTIKSDLLKFAKDYVQKGESGSKRSSIDILRDFFTNRESYVEAWNAAKRVLAKKYKGKTDYNPFLDSTITYNGVGTDSVMTRAIVEDCASQELKARNIEVRTALDRDGLSEQIAGSIIQKTGAEGADAAMIRDAVSRYLVETYSGTAEQKIDADVKAEIKNMGKTAAEVIRSGSKDKASLASEIAARLVKEYGISQESAKSAAETIVERFNQYVAAESERALKQRFGEKAPKKKKSFVQGFTELANMGAFTNENWKSAVTQKLFKNAVTIDETLINEFLNAGDQDARDAVMEKIYENVGQQIPTTFSEAITQWRYMAMMLTPSTHIKNMSSNLAMLLMKLGKDAVGAGIEKTANAISRGKIGRTKSVLNLLSKGDQALLQKAWSDFPNVQDDVAGTGKYQDNVMGKAGEYRNLWKLNDPKTKAGKTVDKVLRTAEKVPQLNAKLMDLEDRLFSQPDYAISLAGYMKANKLTEITPEARTYAIKEAQKATFRDLNAVSDFARKMGHSNSKFWNGFINTIFPFKSTPANVGVRAVEYSPAGLVKTVLADSIRLKRGNITATEFIDNLSAGLTGGAAFAALGWFLAQNGWLRATGVGDEKEKEQQLEQGYKDNSFILFGYSVQEQAFTPISVPMFVGATAYEVAATKALTGEFYNMDDWLHVLTALADPILGQTMLDGLNDTLNTVRYTQGTIGDLAVAVGVNTAGNYLASLLPTLLSRISAAADDVGRETYVDKNKPLGSVQREIQDLMMKTPLRQQLHEKVDNYGRTQETWLKDDDNSWLMDGLGFLANVVTPSYPSKIKTSDVEDELARLYRSGVDTSGKKVFQTDAATYITVDGKKINLTQDQHEEFEKIRGESTMEYLGALQDSSLYDNLDDASKLYATDKAYDFIEQTAKELLGIGYAPDDWVAELEGKSPEEVADAIMLKTFMSLAENKKNYDSKYDGITSMLDSGTIDEAMAVSLLPKEANDGYYKYIKGSGIELSTFIDVYQFKNDATSDKDKDGKTTKSAQEKVIEYINKVVKDPGQKRAAFLALYTSDKNCPW